MTSFISLIGPAVDIEYQDKKYNLSPLSFRDFAAILLRYQFKELNDFKKLEDTLSSELYKQKEKEILEFCLNKKYKDSSGKEFPLSWEMPEVQKFSETHEGIAYQFYLSLKHKHPDVTEKIADEICAIQTYQDILSKLLVVQGLVTDEDSQMGESKPNQ